MNSITLWLLFQKGFSSSANESAWETENHNLSFSDNEMLPDSQIKQKHMQWCIQFLCAENLSKEEPPESYDRKLNTVENGRNNEVDDTEKSSDEGQDIHLQIDSKKGYSILSFKSS